MRRIKYQILVIKVVAVDCPLKKQNLKLTWMYHKDCKKKLFRLLSKNQKAWRLFQKIKESQCILHHQKLHLLLRGSTENQKHFKILHARILSNQMKVLVETLTKVIMTFQESYINLNMPTLRSQKIKSNLVKITLSNIISTNISQPSSLTQ